ncbi:MAG: hypothetical protein OXP73_13770 [Chloroflexota bacterium]|nr:hypothetical protein [Chloroflexota bacterium]MDE2904080.1 hypothetical protein [Chloroflexota bacterium]
MGLRGSSSQRRSAVQRLRETKRRGTEWLLARVGPDGGVQPSDEGFRYYRLPWTLTVAGHTQAATAVCGWIREYMLTPDGDFDRGHRRLYDAYAYRNATLVYGAHMARQFDLSSRGLEFILTMQDRASGGFANDRDPDGTLGDVMDLPYTCGCGLACIALGRLDKARQVYRFLERVWNAQSELPDRLYYSYSRRDQAVITSYDARNRFWHVVESQEPRPQRWTVGGLSAAFLCRLYMVDPKPDYLSLARDFQQFSIQSTPRQFEFPQVCKSGWGAALLYQVTSEEQYAAWAVKLAHWFADTQTDDGSWVFDSDPTEGRTLELTAEFVAHVDTIIGCLASRP